MRKRVIRRVSGGRNKNTERGGFDPTVKLEKTENYYELDPRVMEIPKMVKGLYGRYKLVHRKPSPKKPVMAAGRDRKRSNPLSRLYRKVRGSTFRSKRQDKSSNRKGNK